MPCSVWQKGTRSPECYGLKRARVVWSAALHLRRAPSRFNPMIIALFLKGEYATKPENVTDLDKQSPQSLVRAPPCDTLRAPDI